MHAEERYQFSSTDDEDDDDDDGEAYIASAVTRQILSDRTLRPGVAFRRQEIRLFNDAFLAF